MNLCSSIQMASTRVMHYFQSNSHQDFVAFAASIVQRYRTTLQGKACWCIRCELVQFSLQQCQHFKYYSISRDHFVSLENNLNCQIMWAEAIAKLEGMESSKRERLWPQLVQGFKDLSQRLKVHEVRLIFFSYFNYFGRNALSH